MKLLHNRADAGRQLAEALATYTCPPELEETDVLVLGLLRGGVPVAHAIARNLYLPLGIFIVRKLGVPGREELAMGAVASGNVRILNQGLIEALAIPDEVIEATVAAEMTEIARREAMYGIDDRVFDLTGKTVILVDDGLATGASMRAAIAALRPQQPARIVLAIGVAPPETCAALAPLVDELVCLLQPADFGSVGMWYEDFTQVTDEEVATLLSY